MGMNPRLLRPTESGFNPRRIAGLGIWLDATVDASLTFNGNTVSEWRDLSGNGRHFAQTTAGNQPNGVSTTQNGRRVLAFSGSQFMDGNAAALNLLQNVPGGTVISVLQFTSASENYVVLRVSNNLVSARLELGQTTSAPAGTYIGGRRLDADSFALISHAADTSARVRTGILDYANSDAYIYRDGTLENSTSSFQTSGNTSNTASGLVRIGANNIGGGGFSGWIAECLVWPRALADAERQRVERYLGRKWGITVA